MPDLMIYNKNTKDWQCWRGIENPNYWKEWEDPWIPVVQGKELEKTVEEWYPNCEFIIGTQDPYGECVTEIRTIGEKPKPQLQQKDPIEAKIQALTDNQDFLEDCLVEMASLVYN